jgi:hypothetical protein
MEGVRERRDFYVRTIRWDVTCRAHCDEATREEARYSDLARLQRRGKLERGVLNYGHNNRCTRVRRERGLGVLFESTEEVTWRDHRDDAT